ncbi:MAG: DUF3021 family protein [Anaeroplasma sp.]|uniref:DUF3021 family protein n=1 Tax=Anaeroplasma sp. TaxID=1872523 RepID=UPI002A91D80C|nr:DUF3021 family protein [Anaeroplasma sp.]MDY5983753.1 DUF3021 family protein [Anaeroplasma sp.]
MRIVKMIAMQFLLITVGMLLGIGLMNVLLRDYNDLPWFFPFEILAVALSTALASLVYLSKNELSKKGMMIRQIIHFILLLVIVYSFGYLFKWWSELSGILIVGAIFLGIYAIVFIVTYRMERKDSFKINEALKKLPKDEE